MTSRTIETSLRLGLLRCLFGGDFGAVILVIVDSTVVILVDCLVAHGWAGPICLILEHEMPQLKRDKMLYKNQNELLHTTKVKPMNVCRCHVLLCALCHGKNESVGLFLTI